MGSKWSGARPRKTYTATAVHLGYALEQKHPCTRAWLQQSCGEALKPGVHRMEPRCGPHLVVCHAEADPLLVSRGGPSRRRGRGLGDHLCHISCTSATETHTLFCYMLQDSRSSDKSIGVSRAPPNSAGSVIKASAIPRSAQLPWPLS